MKTPRILKATAWVAILYLFAAQAQPHPVALDVPGAPIPTRVLVQSPADTQTELQVICLFQSDPSNTLHGSLAEINERLHGVLDQIRKPMRFTGSLGETLLITPGGKIPTKRLLIIGLGDSQSFTPQRLELVGAIVYHEASRLGVASPFFAPTILDGGVTRFATGETAQWFVRGFIHAAATEKILASAGDANGATVRELTFLAGAQHAKDTAEGIAKGYAEAAGN
jgi:hypothetical protein